MVVLQFGSDDIRRACCDPDWMRRRWGDEATHSLCRRLQQLEAMEAVADLAFLPFDSLERDGIFEITVTGQLALFIEQRPVTSQQGTLMNTITITGIRERATTARLP